MALLVSSWCKEVKSVPEVYVMPPERRAGDIDTVCKEIPVVDLQNDHSNIVQQIIKACKEVGVFQVVNHGVSDKMMEDIKVLSDEFFNLPVEDKLSLYSGNNHPGVTLTTGLPNHFTKQDVHYWRDSLRHQCHPLEEHSPSWPDKPARYKEVVGRYAVEVRKMGLQILDLIGEGLGLPEGYFNGPVTQQQMMVFHHYPLCPDPDLAMGLPNHYDPNLITFLQQDNYGLQIEKDGKWMGVELVPNAFVINLGYQLHVISNGTLKAPEHRAFLNPTASRTSIGTFLGPNHEHELPAVIGPAKELITSSNPPVFKSYRCDEFIADYFAFVNKPRPRIGPRTGSPLDPYRL